MAGVLAKKKEIDKLEREKEALSQKHSTDSEIVKYVTTSYTYCDAPVNK